MFVIGREKKIEPEVSLCVLERAGKKTKGEKMLRPRNREGEDTVASAF